MRESELVLCARAIEVSLTEIPRSRSCRSQCSRDETHVRCRRQVSCPSSPILCYVCREASYANLATHVRLSRITTLRDDFAVFGGFVD